MCEPVTIATIAVVAAGASAYAQVQAGNAQANAMEAQAQVDRAQAADALQRGAAEAGKVKTAGSLAVSENKAALAGAGVDVQSGSAVKALEDTRLGSELDAGTVRSNAARAAWGHEVQAQQEEYGAKAARYSSRIGAAATFIGGAASAGAGYYGMTKVK